jgi:protein O-GlcNAc transferase
LPFSSLFEILCGAAFLAQPSGNKYLVTTTAEALAIALEHHQAGNFPQAEQVYRQILQAEPQNVDALHLLGVLAHQVGRNEAAIEWIGHALALNPNYAIAHSHLGEALRALGRNDEAIACYQRALQLDPNSAQSYNNMSNAFKAQGRLDEALACCQQALRLMPDLPEAHNNLGTVYKELGQLDEAMACYQRAIQLKPDLVESYNNLGSILQTLGRADEGIAVLQQALQVRPGFATAWFNLGNALKEQGRMDEAGNAFYQAVQSKPDFFEALNNLGAVLKERWRLDEAVAVYQQALRLRPDAHQTLYNLGNALQSQNKLQDAEAVYRRVLELDASSVDAHNNLGNLLNELGRLDEAGRCYEESVRLNGTYIEAYNNLGSLRQSQGRLTQASAAYRQALEIRPDHAQVHSNYLFCINHIPEFSPQALWEEHLKWGQRHADPLAREALPHTNVRDPDRRLRVGYVSPDLFQHAVSYFIEPVLQYHDATRFETFCYAEVVKPDDGTAKLRSLSQHWRSTCGLSDAEVAAQIRADDIDILVDLAGHTARHRLLAMARCPAPVQVTYLGYPNTTGMQAVDYRLTDAVADPPGEPSLYTEELVRLPEIFCSFGTPDDAPDVVNSPAGRSGPITFGSMHKLSKLNDRVLDLWCRILDAVPHSRLLVFRDTLTGAAREHLLSRFAERKIPPEQLDIRNALVTGRDHRAVYGEIDISLDSIPWCGHTTACESLWMGVPMITLRGDRHAGRMGASVLTCVGVPQWIVSSDEEYLSLAVELANDRGQLSHWRHRLRPQMIESPLCDGKGFTRRLEEAYRKMWQTWCAAEN